MAYSRSSEPAAVDHPMQKGHQHQMRGDLVIGRAAEQRLAVLAPEGEKGVQKSGGIEVALFVSQVGVIWGSESCGPPARLRGSTSR